MTVNEIIKLLGAEGNKYGLVTDVTLELNCKYKIRNEVIDEFVSKLIPRLTDAIYQKDVESMTNLINDVARELKEGSKNE